MNSQEISVLCHQFANIKQEGDNQHPPSVVSRALHRPITVQWFYRVERAMISLRSSVLGQVIAKVIECVNFATLLPIFVAETTLSAVCTLILAGANAVLGKRLQESKARGEAYCRSTLATMGIAGIALFRKAYISSHTQAVLQEQKTYQQALLSADKINQLFHAHLPLALQAIQKAFHSDLSSGNLIDCYQPTTTLDEELATDIAESKIQEGFIRLATFFKQVPPQQTEEFHENENSIVEEDVDGQNLQQNNGILHDQVEDDVIHPERNDRSYQRDEESHINAPPLQPSLEQSSLFSAYRQLSAIFDTNAWDEIIRQMPYMNLEQLQELAERHNAEVQARLEQHRISLQRREAESRAQLEQQRAQLRERYEREQAEEQARLQQQQEQLQAQDELQLAHVPVIRIDLSNTEEWQSKITQCIQQLNKHADQLVQLDSGVWNSLQEPWQAVIASFSQLREELSENKFNCLIEQLKELNERLFAIFSDASVEFGLSRTWTNENRLYHLRETGRALRAMYEDLLSRDPRRDALSRYRYNSENSRLLRYRVQLIRHIQEANHYIKDRPELWGHIECEGHHLQDIIETIDGAEQIFRFANLAQLIEIEQCICYPQLISDVMRLNGRHKQMEKACQLFSTLSQEEREIVRKWTIGDTEPFETYRHTSFDRHSLVNRFCQLISELGSQLSKGTDLIGDFDRFKFRK